MNGLYFLPLKTRKALDFQGLFVLGCKIVAPIGLPLLGEQREKAPVGLFLEAKSSTQGVEGAIYDCNALRKERSDGIASSRASYAAGQESGWGIVPLPQWELQYAKKKQGLYQKTRRILLLCHGRTQSLHRKRSPSLYTREAPC